MSDTSTLAGKRIVITGASRGIGLVIARELASQGASLVLVARNQEALERARALLHGDAHDIIALDVRDESAWAEAAIMIDGHGAIDGLVTAAGVLGPIGPAGTWSVDDFRSVIDINVTGTLLAVLACLAGLKHSSGSIVSLSGGGATAPLPRFDAYATSKAAVVRLSENLAVDLASDGVRVNSIAPGFIVTEMHNETIAAGPELVGQEYFDRTLRAVEGGGDSPQDAARLSAFLLSDQATGISGKLLSARWDPWVEAAFRDRLRADPDFCTIRRIDNQFFTSLKRS